MELQQLEDRALELEEIESSFSAALDVAKKELVESQAELRVIRFIGDVEKFIKNLTEEAGKVQTTDERFTIVASGLARLAEYSRAEPIRIRDRVVATSERVAVIEGTLGMIKSRRISYLGKVEAIRRVVDGTGDPKHPEKISTVREAERVKKLRKADS